MDIHGHVLYVFYGGFALPSNTTGWYCGVESIPKITALR